MTYTEAMKYLEKHGLRIGMEADQKNELAEEVIAAYEFHYAAPGDPGGQALLVMAIENYREEKKV